MPTLVLPRQVSDLQVCGWRAPESQPDDTRRRAATAHLRSDPTLIALCALQVRAIREQDAGDEQDTTKYGPSANAGSRHVNSVALWTKSDLRPWTPSIVSGSASSRMDRASIRRTGPRP